MYMYVSAVTTHTYCYMHSRVKYIIISLEMTVRSLGTVANFVIWQIFRKISKLKNSENLSLYALMV